MLKKKCHIATNQREAVVKNSHDSRCIRSSSLTAFVKACGALVVLIAVLGVSPGIAKEGPTDVSVWEILAQEPSATDLPFSSLEKRILQVLTPEQAESFTNGADPNTIVLANRETLAEFLSRGEKISEAGLVLKPTYPCRMLDTRASGPKFSADETRAFIVRGAERDYSPQGGTALGCGVPDLTGRALKTNAARAVLLNVEAFDADGEGSVAIWAAEAEDMPEIDILSYDGSSGQCARGLAIVPICGEESINPCVEGDIRVQARGAGAHLAISVLGYFEPADAGMYADTEEEQEEIGDRGNNRESQEGRIEHNKSTVGPGDEHTVRLCAHPKTGRMRLSFRHGCLGYEVPIDLLTLNGAGDIEVPDGDLTIADGDLVVEEGDADIAGGLEVTGLIHSPTGLSVGNSLNLLSDPLGDPEDRIEATEGSFVMVKGWDVNSHEPIGPYLTIDTEANKITASSGTLDFDDENLNTKGEISGRGIVPVGTIVAWHRDLPGMPPLPLPDGWQECDGSPITEGPLAGSSTPDLNGQGLFLRGGSGSGVEQGASLRAHEHGAGQYEAQSASVPLEDNTHVHSPAVVHIPIVNHEQRWSWGVTDGSWDHIWENHLTLGKLQRVEGPWDVAMASSTHGHGGGAHGHQLGGMSAAAPVHADPAADDETRPINMSIVWIMRVE